MMTSIHLTAVDFRKTQCRLEIKKDVSQFPAALNHLTNVSVPLCAPVVIFDSVSFVHELELSLFY